MEYPLFLDFAHKIHLTISGNKVEYRHLFLDKNNVFMLNLQNGYLSHFVTSFDEHTISHGGGVTSSSVAPGVRTLTDFFT